MTETLNPPPRACDGVIFGVPEMQHATDEERQDFARNLLRQTQTEGLPTKEALAAQAPPQVGAPAPQPPPEDRASRFRVKDYRTEVYTLPNGEVVFVHPVSLQETSWASQQALRKVRAL